jgi:DNA-binding NarL/FixJ family response regulator
METIRILVVDETPGLTQDLLLALRRRIGIQVLGPVPDHVAALEVCAELRPDVAVVQLDRQDDAGITAVAAIREGSSTRVLTATRHPAAPLVELALAAGACGVLPTERCAASLVRAFQQAIAGVLVLPTDGMPAMLNDVRESRPRMAEMARLATLTRREREVLAALAGGSTTRGISLEMGISSATVQSHIKNILGKLCMHSQVEAVGAAWRAGLAVSSRSA